MCCSLVTNREAAFLVAFSGGYQGEPIYKYLFLRVF